ncbi:hypothetical protein SAMN04490194_0688 [Pseudomonas migulae]|uniref:Uncharacterized protein n=1 Tax=Pseudomonas migulae TaxID=78543 RepID=A0A1H5FBB0_9PSED|nr:hypothetical protein FBY04_103434 [Pseudomonas sp. SJZ080]SEE00672.1 hypothetical protein SAMN04490194_0688 [Pseudomonas migulae]
MQLFFVGLIITSPLKLIFAAPYTGTEARVELADEIERRNLWLTNRQWIRKI